MLLWLTLWRRLALVPPICIREVTIQRPPLARNKHAEEKRLDTEQRAKLPGWKQYQPGEIDDANGLKYKRQESQREGRLEIPTGAKLKNSNSPDEFAANFQ